MQDSASHNTRRTYLIYFIYFIATNKKPSDRLPLAYVFRDLHDPASSRSIPRCVLVSNCPFVNIPHESKNSVVLLNSSVIALQSILVHFPLFMHRAIIPSALPISCPSLVPAPASYTLALLPQRNIPFSPFSNCPTASHKGLHTTPKKASSNAFLKTAAARRTYYDLKDTSPIPDSHIQELVHDTIKHTPSPFNSQTTRVALVLKDEHNKLWGNIMGVYEAMLPADHFAHAKGRMEGFSKGHGTTLFYEDMDVVKEMQGKFASYADKFFQCESSLRRFISLSALQPLNFICL